VLDLTPAWVASCGRCANEGISEEEEHDDAHVDLRVRGWTRGDRQLCPDCSKETAPRTTVPADATAVIVCPKCGVTIGVDHPPGTHYVLVHEGPDKHVFTRGTAE